ncbi:serine--tRNA ligase [Fodinicurvata halophila]|uniref:Serine--tRNA ligase n=1 Tax=Fodinicurvata halophila TaxID=1419723 RepID=A0ABV8UIL2_9PROT
MLDRKFILENLEAVRSNCANRGIDVDLDSFAELDGKRRSLQQEVDRLNQEANATAKSIKDAKDPDERQKLIDQGKQLRTQRAEAEEKLQQAKDELEALQSIIPNMSHPAAPIGASDADNAELERGATPLPSFDFKPLDHLEIGEKLDLIDMEAGSKVTGHGFYFLKNDAVLLDLALQNYALNILVKDGFAPVTTPDLARNEVMRGTGYVPRGAETQIYSIAETDLSLIATSEITLAGLQAGEILPQDQMPIKLCGISHCFRTEAGAHGRASRGLYRVHQFTKVEMFAFTMPDGSPEMHQRMLDLEKQIFDGLGIPYRVIENATGDLGAAAYRKYDLEAWMPGRGDGGEFGEITSTSNCTDYQARRLNIRYRGEDGKVAGFLHTLNGTAIAISRALIAILENYQQADGSVRVPEVLRPFLGKDVIGSTG